MLQACLFDFDGTLVDSMPTFSAVMLRILEENRIAYDRDIIKTITPLGYQGTARYFKQLGIPLAVEEIMSRIREYAIQEYAYRIPAKKNVVSTLLELKARGIDLNVLTASPHCMLDPCLRRLGIFELFSHVWSCDDFSTTKADPAIYTMAAERLGIPVGDILFVDDNCNADRTGKLAGMQVCGIYDESSAEFVREMQEAADAYVYDFSELLSLF